MKVPSNPECVYGKTPNQLDIIHAYDIQYTIDRYTVYIYIHDIPNGAADLNPMKKNRFNMEIISPKDP